MSGQDDILWRRVARGGVEGEPSQRLLPGHLFPGLGRKEAMRTSLQVKSAGCRVASGLLCKQKVPNSLSLVPFPTFPVLQDSAASGKEETKMSSMYNPPCPGIFQL